MRAFIVPEFGQPGVVGERPTPQPGEGEILVRVQAAGVNAMDPMVRAGYLKDYMEHRFPLTLGMEYAGTVEAVGPGVSGFEVGDDVFGALGKPHLGEGSFAEHVTARADLAAKRPAGLSPDKAAALPTAGGTALAAVDALEASAGDTIAIVGAAGGVGSYATRLATLRGLRVIGVTHGDNADYVRRLGATDIVDYTAGDVAEQLRQRVPDGVAGIIDMFDDVQGCVRLAAAVRPGGRIVSASAMGLDQALAGQQVTGRVVNAALDRVAELGQLAADGKLDVETTVVPFDGIAKAVDRQAAKRVRGKQVVVVDTVAS